MPCQRLAPVRSAGSDWIAAAPALIPDHGAALGADTERGGHPHPRRLTAWTKRVL